MRGYANKKKTCQLFEGIFLGETFLKKYHKPVGLGENHPHPHPSQEEFKSEAEFSFWGGLSLLNELYLNKESVIWRNMKNYINIITPTTNKKFETY